MDNIVEMQTEIQPKTNNILSSPTMESDFESWMMVKKLSSYLVEGWPG